MKTSTNILRNISTGTLSELTLIVDETIAGKKQLSTSKPFKAADLWNIQRRTKTALSKRQYL